MALGFGQISSGRMFRILLLASVAVPLFLFAGSAWLTYSSAFHESERDLVLGTDILQEHALKVLETNQLLSNRVSAIMTGLEGDDPASERAVHEALKRAIAGLPQVRVIWVLDRNGRSLASSSTYPVPRDVDFSDRDYFVALRDRTTDTYISEVLKGRVDQALFFTVAKRLELGGEFDGVVSISADPTYFGDFYERQARSDDYLFGLVRSDGSLLARYPAVSYPFPKLGEANPLMAAIREGRDRGSFTNTSQTDGNTRIAAFRKVSGYPIYVVAGRTTTSIIGDWRSAMAGHLVFGIPATLCLVALTLLAARRTQREREALALLGAEMLRREETEKALLQAQKMEAIGRITSGVAHDFNNVLQGVGGCLGALHARNTDPSAERLFLAAQQGIDRGARLTQHLLAFARRQTLAPKPTDIGTMFDGMRPLLERSMGGLIAIRIEPAAGVWPALVDPTQLEVALLNLAINARDAMPEGGTLTLGAANTTVPVSGEAGHPPELAPGAYVTISVQDTGTGMDAATLARAVEPFFTTKETGKGSGLGLSMVYGMTAQSGGGARIDSQPGRGTTVWLYLPRAEQPAEPPSPTVLYSVPGNGSTVLLVDDDALVRDATTALLEAQGYRVLATDSGAAALAVLQGGTRIDVLVSDYAMPGMTGAVLVREARRIVPGLKALLVTGYAELPDGVEPVPLLKKPFRPGELTEQLALLTGAARSGTAVASTPA